MSKKGQKIGSDNKSTLPTNGRADGVAQPPANAWSQPLRPKTNAVHGPPPGMGGKSLSPAASIDTGGSGNSASNGVQNALRERFIGLTLNMVGQKVIVTQTNGAIFEGVFHTFTPFKGLPQETKNKFVIKACRVLKPPPTTDLANEPQVADQSTVIISADKVACLVAKSMRIDSLAPGVTSNGASKQKGADAFRTDKEISGGRGGRSTDLVAAGSAWTTGGGTSRADAMMGALEEKDKGARRKPFGSNANSGLRGGIGEWDQFRANQELFNVNATFDENLYTTELDKSQIDNRKIAEAERLAREIENTTSTNLHIAEERGHIVQGDYDEEDRYSGVLKDSALATQPTFGKPKAAVAEPLDKGKVDDTKLASLAPKKMNYAAAAAKADTTKPSGGPPGFAPKTKQPKDAKSQEEHPDKDLVSCTLTEQKPPQPQKETSTGAISDKEPESMVEETRATPAEADQTKTAAAVHEKDMASKDGIAEKDPAPGDADAKANPTSDEADEKPETKLASKLNANAKEFTLNPSAKTFTPGGVAPVAAALEGQFVDPNAAMHLGQVPTHMPAPHYMHGSPMGQPGMMPMMSPQFPGARYPTGYGVDQQHMQMQVPPQHIPAQGGAPSPGPASVDEDAAQSQADGEGAAQQLSVLPPQQQPQPGQPPQQPQQVPMPYGVPPHGAYYATGMAMPPRPGGPHQGFHHPQYVSGPQQIPVGPAGAPYRHMYPMQPGGMSPNVQVRGPGGPYYGGPVAPVPYPHQAYVGHGMIDDDQGFRGGGRGARGNRGSGRGRGRRNQRGGRGSYTSYHQQGGRHSVSNNQNAQSMPTTENWTAGDGGNHQPDYAVAGPPPEASKVGNSEINPNQ